MDVKAIWTDSDFEAMGWHDCRLYGLVVPDEDFNLSFDIDYIFKWEKSSDETTGFWVSPCDLVFENVSNFKVEMEFKDSLLLFVGNVNRGNRRLSPNGQLTVWDYEIECDNGVLSFSATGFNQHIRKQPILSASQDLNKGR